MVSETDGCFVDGITAAIGCTVGHRTLRVEDYGKIAVTCVNVNRSYAVRVAPRLDVRARASAFLPNESRPHFAQMQAYRIIPDDQLLTLQEVDLNTSIKQMVSSPSISVNCAVCGEEIVNEREIKSHGLSVCCTCAGMGYYQPAFQQNPTASNQTSYGTEREVSHIPSE